MLSLERSNDQPNAQERRKWKEQPKYTTRYGKNKEVAIKTPWSKQGRQRYLQILKEVTEDREKDKEKGVESVEMEFMKDMKDKHPMRIPDDKKQKLKRQEDDVVMPIWNTMGIDVERLNEVVDVENEDGDVTEKNVVEAAV